MNRFAAACALLLALGHHEAFAFRSAARLHNNLQSSSSARFAARKTMVLEREADVATASSYDPLNLASSSHMYTGRLQARDTSSTSRVRPTLESDNDNNKNQNALWASSVALAPFVMMGGAEQANAVESIISKEMYNPASFQPVCPTSDGFYRFLQTGIEAIVGREKFIEYGPLIAGGLLRVRLELCVVESFFNEAVGPFIKENGVSWILPLHETVETFLAGSIFALATTFILVGSTKLLTVITTYFDLLVSTDYLESSSWGGALTRARNSPTHYQFTYCIECLRLGWNPITNIRWLFLRPRLGPTRDIGYWIWSFQNPTVGPHR